jgi:hypothetical protein
MPHKTFVVPVRDASASEDVLNEFIRSHRVLEMDRKWVDQGANSFWAVWVDYLDSAAESGSAAKRRVDYKEVLSPEDFAAFSQLRIVREITDVFSIPSPCPLPSGGARVQRTVISRTILRALRKKIAEEEGVALYNVLNDEQLACIVQNRSRTLDDLQQILGS